MQRASARSEATKTWTVLTPSTQPTRRIARRSLHVDALKKKKEFIHSIPAFANIPEAIVSDLAGRVFFEKVPIHKRIWEQGEKWRGAKDETRSEATKHCVCPDDSLCSSLTPF